MIGIVYLLCLAGATFNHVQAVLTHGWLLAQLSETTAFYWSSLTLVDPLAAVLLFVRPRMGIALTALIIVSDVAHNPWFIANHPLARAFVQDVPSSAFMMSQIAFLVFLAAAAFVAWPEARRGSE